MEEEERLREALSVILQPARPAGVWLRAGEDE